jgi:hypothetical protein
VVKIIADMKMKEYISAVHFAFLNNLFHSLIKGGLMKNLFHRHIIFLIHVMGFLFFTGMPIQLVSAQVRSVNGVPEELVTAVKGKNSIVKKGVFAKAGIDLVLLNEEFKQHISLTPQGAFHTTNPVLTVSNNRVLVDIIVRGDLNLRKAELEAEGMQITGAAGGIVSGYLPITALENTSALEKVRGIHPSVCIANAGSVMSQGDSVMHSNLVRSSLGYDGTGVKVGILSDSYDALGGAAADVASGDLPGAGNPEGHTTPVTVIEDVTGTSDEGRAMLQIVHDVAPGASLAFATAWSGQAGFANNITALRNAGANIICDDVFYYAEPMFQDGVIAQAVDSAVAAGVAYFSSAGNQGRQSYESQWRSGPELADGSVLGNYSFYGGTALDFDATSGVDYLQSFTIGPSSTMNFVLQWDSPFASNCPTCPGSANDLDMYILYNGSIVSASTYDNIDGDAFEFAGVSNGSTTDSYTIELLIVKYSGNDPGFLKYVCFGDAQGNLEYATNSSTIYGHANAVGAEAVGAAPYFYTPAYGVTPPVLEYFSSAGPTAVRFAVDGSAMYDARAGKPEITAPDGGNTTFFYSDFSGDADSYPNFFGTSAAAPHAAGVAALLLNCNNTLSPENIYAALEGTAIDMETSGFDNNTGYGLIQADAAIENALPVELTSFTAVAKGKNIELVWSTATELNNHGFEVERRVLENRSLKVNGSLEWNKISFVAGNGTSNNAHSYTYTDASINGTIAYRIKQIDNDGKFVYSNVVEATITNTPAEFGLMQNYPNPFNPTTNFSYALPTASHVTLKVYDIIGNEVATLVNGTQEAGVQHVQFNASKLSSGMYFYTINAGGFTATKKLLLLK